MKSYVGMLLTLFGSIFISSCDTTSIEDALESISVVIELPKIDTEVSVQFVDATTGALIEQPVEVLFFGDQRGNAQIIDMYSDVIEEFTATKGFMNVGIQNGTSISEASPVVMGLKISSTGYKDQTTSFTIKSTGQNYVVLEMIPLLNPPSGVSVIKDALPNVADNGVLTSPITFNATETTGPLAPTVGFNLPEGTLLKDADGIELNGQLEMEIVIYNVSEAGISSLANTTLLNSEEDSSRVIYGLWETKLMDQNGRVATSMSIPAAKKTGTCESSFGVGSVTSGCNKISRSLHTYSPFDGNPLFQNPLWWFGTPNPTPPPSPIIIEFEPISFTLPSWSQPVYGWLSDFNFESCVIGLTTVDASPSCYGESPSNNHMVSQKTEAKDIEVNIDRNGHTSSLSVTLTSKGGYSKTQELLGGVDNIIFEKTHAPVTDEDYTLEVQIASRPDRPVKKTFGRDDYESGLFSIQLPEADPDLIDASLTVNLQCSNPDESPTISDIPTASFYYQLAGFEIDEFLPWIPAMDITFDVGDPIGFVTGGNVTLNDVLTTKTYTMKLVYDDEVIMRDVLITGPQVEYNEVLPDNICQ